MLGALALVLLVGCDPDCDDTDRIDGEYVVNSHVSVESAEITGQNLEAYPYEDVFFNGWSTWTLEYNPGKQTFQVLLDGQPYEAAYTQDPDNCNAFTLTMQGVYTGEGGITHTFSWTGELVYLGVKLRGTFTYSDTWEDALSGETGSIVVPAGELLANPKGGADTGR